MDREAHSAAGVEHRMKRTGFGIAQNLERSRAALLDLPSVMGREESSSEELHLQRRAHMKKRVLTLVFDHGSLATGESLGPRYHTQNVRKNYKLSSDHLGLFLQRLGRVSLAL
ncbi:hypothetical protein OIDMADRAFT_51549 [Oidiodendron maius Zn]|uniref:Uncharacterized protein n=1 Tax=Oidiodendron maius (strain Zn) TaxID=913774 RepID=A0A0C3HKM7_OIDMZ|nr:hypothetical protein OIDMADRAFT_51549 [Oidiodendron maius Zn]